MAQMALRPGFEGSREATTDDLKSLPATSHEAVHVLEQCIADHHIAEVDYREPEDRLETIRLRPAFIRYSTAHNLVLWGLPDRGSDWIELRLDRITRVRDTGDVFEPTR